MRLASLACVLLFPLFACGQSLLPGEIVLVDEEFDGPALAGPWSFGSNSSGGTFSLHDGQIDLTGGGTDGGGAWIETPDLFAPAPGTILTLRVRARVDSPTANWFMGLVNFDFGGGYDHRGSWAWTYLADLHSMCATSTLPFLENHTPHPGIVPTDWHDYRLVHDGTRVNYFVDGRFVDTHTLHVPSGHPMRLRLDQSSRGASHTSSVSSVLLTSRPAPSAEGDCEPGPGETVLVHDDFDGPGLMAPWTFGTNGSGSSATVAGGVLTIHGGSTDGGGAWVETPDTWDPAAGSYSLRVRARFLSASANVFLGLVSIDEDGGDPRAVAGFSWQQEHDRVVVILRSSGPDLYIPVEGLDPTEWHDYLVVRDGASLHFEVDGVPAGDFLLDVPAANAMRVRLDQSSTGTSQPSEYGCVLLTVTPATPPDTTPPAISSASATPSVLWPPNHRMVEVEVNVEATDDGGAAPSCSIVAVTSDEPTEGLGDGDTPVDWEVTGALTLKLRAERSGKGDGRVYSITVACTDAAGNTSHAVVEVKVPKNKSK